jgi:replicative DNA helicase
VVAIDHALLIARPDIGRGANSASQYSETARKIKEIAQRLGICVLLLCQVNRQAKEGEPSMGDLKESGGFEEFADAVLILWQKADAEAAPDKPTPVWAKLAKNRGGQGGWRRELGLRGAVGHFNEMERDTGSAPPPPLRRKPGRGAEL